ncbi:MAG: helix-turn-helix transcriptional regulator [Bacteroidia bacterium]
MQNNTPKPKKSVTDFQEKDTVKNSFYDIPYIPNNPQLMIENFSKTPGVTFDAKQQFFMAQTPVFDVKTNYKNCGGMYVISTEIDYKANVCFKAMKTLPSNYYCLSLRINNATKKNKSLANDFSYSDKAWLLFKPNALFNHYHFNGTKGTDFSIYFTLDWLKKHLKQSPLKNRKTIQLFLDSTADFLVSTNLSEILKMEDSKLKNIVDISTDNDVILTEKVDFIFSAFILALQQENITANHFEVSNFHRIKILEAEKIIQSYKYKKFPSINYIANKLGISETKLKQHFKTVYGCTLLQYFQTLQMEEAKLLLVANKYKIAEIAHKMGYENVSKFSARFKKEFGVLPSLFK